MVAHPFRGDYITRPIVAKGLLKGLTLQLCCILLLTMLLFYSQKRSISEMKRRKRYGQKTQRNLLHLMTRSLAKLRRQKRHLMAPLTSVNGLCSSLREQVSFYKHEDAVLVK